MMGPANHIDDSKGTTNMILRWLLLVLPLVAVGLVTGLLIRNRTNERIVSGGRTRRYLLYVPESYDPGQPVPLVVSLHGFVQWAAHQQEMSGWNALADEHGFFVVYPQGTGFPLRWHAQPMLDDPGGMASDVQFISDLLDHLCSTFAIDESRIYVNGMSNGGGMTHLLACRMPERIAAIGGVAGAYLYQPGADEPGRPMPVMAFHGTDDPIVPYAGGRSKSKRHPITFTSVEAWTVGWAARNGCAEPPKVAHVAEDVRVLRYAGCSDDAEVVLYTIEGGGHTWPGGQPLPRWLTGSTCTSINASELLWAFFCRHALTRS